MELPETLKTVAEKIFALLILLTFVQGCKTDKTPYVVMLSLDGFRWDYPEKFETPNLNRLEDIGVKARSLIPCFPTKTFPNHYSIVTGLYPDHHGIVANSFYDSKMNAFYSIRDRDAVRNPDFYGGEPIWVTAELQGVKAASYFWVGSETKIKNTYASYWKEYFHDFPFSQRLDSVITWLQLPKKKRPHLVTWYMDEPDSHSHKTGPYDSELGPTIHYLDSLVGVFLSRLNDLPVRKKINIIITSDHGMSETSSERWINLSEYLDPDWFSSRSGANPINLLFAKPEYYDSAWTALENIPNIQVWKSGTVPERYHYGTNPRTGDFIMVADSSYSLTWRPAPETFVGGSHGYDNLNTDMHAIFYAAGPAFKKGVSYPSFENIHIYPLICEILRLKPASVDGELEAVKPMLKGQ